MKKLLSTVLCLLFIASLSSAQMIKRTDAVWAKSTAGAALTLDGKLDEAAWAKADSIVLKYNADTLLIPGSGYGKWENETTDPTDATVKFLVVDNYLWISVNAKDASIGGSDGWERWDCLFLNFKNKKSTSRPTPAIEVLVKWWGVLGAGQNAETSAWAPFDNKSNFDAKIVVDGKTNSDTTLDKGYIVEMKFNLDSIGYNAKSANGDIIEFNMAIYDMDWNWPEQAAKKSATKVWWQNGWANGNNINVGRVLVNPNVTINSTTIPTIAPDFVIKNGANFATPVLDGKLDDYIWQNGNVSSFKIKYGDDALRAAYPNVGATRSGQYQPAIDGKTAAILDPGEATFKYFFKNDTLYIGIDANDQVICGEADYDKWDGAMLTIESRDARDGDNRLKVNELKIRFDKTKKDTICEGTLLDWVKAGTARIKYALKGTSTLDNINDIDQGYTVELAISLRQLGYPAGRGDGVLFMGASLLDYDAFSNTTDNYCSRAWWFREAGWAAAPAWCYMDPTTYVLGVKDNDKVGIPQSFELIGNYPNPFNPATVVKYSMPSAGYVSIDIYDVVGKLVKTQVMGDQSAGVNSAKINMNNLSTGVYFYQVKMVTMNQVLTTPFAKMMLMK